MTGTDPVRWAISGPKIIVIYYYVKIKYHSFFIIFIIIKKNENGDGVLSYFFLF